jgi:dihydroorotate dehydrogenase (NAD+) catalytic subunit
MVNLSVTIGKMKLKNPVILASGTFGEEYGALTRAGSLGAVIMKTITLKGRTGNTPPRLAETASGCLNSIGLENKGPDDFIKNKLPPIRKLKTPVIASIAGDSEREYSTLAKRLDSAGIAGIEVNLSCPNVKHGTRDGLISQDAGEVRSVIKAVKGSTALTVIAKLTPNVTDIVKIALAAESGGADAVTIANTFPAMAIDINSARPILGNVTGGLSGPAIKPVVLKMVWDTAAKIGIPTIASGGIMDYKDAVEYLLAGATAVQIGTATFVDPDAAADIVRGLGEYLGKKKISGIKGLIGGGRGR